MPEHTNPEPHSPELEHLPLDEVFTRVNKLEATKHAALSSLSETVDQYTSELGDVLDAATGVEDLIARLKTSLHEIAPDSYQTMEPIFTSFEQAVEGQQLLEQTQGERARAEANRVTRDVLVMTDWDGVVHQLTTPPHDEQLTRDEALAAMSIFTTNARPETLIDVGQQFTDAQALREMVDAAGLRLTEPNIESKDGWFTEGKLGESIQEWQRLNEATRPYLSLLRQAWRNENVPTKSLDTLKTALSGMGADTHPLPTQIATAFEKRTAKEITDYSKAEEAYIAADRERAPNSLFIKNISMAAEALEAETGDVSAFVDIFLAGYPKRFTKGLGFITFKDAPIEEGALHDSGEFFGYRNEIEINVGLFKHNREKLEKLGAHPDRAKEIAAQRLSDTLAHELGHFAHQNILTQKEIMLWQEALESEEGAITDYIQSFTVQEPSEMRDYRIRIEQFGESWSQLITNPLNLVSKFPRRFAALNTITGVYSETQVRTLLDPSAEQQIAA